MLVVDASAAIRACDRGGDWSPLGDNELIAPRLMWSEVAASVHAAAWRGARTPEQARSVLQLVRAAPIEVDDDDALLEEAWRIADRLGWAKTYDAEYCALAALRGCRLVTLDGRLRRGADRLGYVVTPAEL